MSDGPEVDTSREREGFRTAMPTTPLGRWSMWMALAFAVGWVINLALVGVVGTTDDAVLSEFSRTYLPYWGILLMSVGFLSGVLGLAAIVRQKERSIVSVLTLAPAAMVLMLVLGEFLLPH